MTTQQCERCRWDLGFGAREPISPHTCTVPPTDDEREALWELIDAERRGLTRIGSGDSMSLTDAILASDVWRNRRQGPITDAQVQAAFESWNGMHVGTVRDRLRAALEAARGA